MKGETLQKLLLLNQNFLTQQQQKIDILMETFGNILEYGSQLKDQKLALILKQGLDKYEKVHESSKLTVLELKALKAKMDEEQKNEENSNI